VGAFLSGRNEKVGYTLLGLYNRQSAYDVDKDDFTEVPKSNEFTLHPKIFFYPNANTTIQIGNSLTMASRIGGDIFVIRNKADASHQYFEKNETLRNISTFELNKIQGNNKLVIKQSLSVFDRKINIPGYLFSGIDKNAYTDLSWLSNVKRHAWVVGVNFIYSDFREKDRGIAARNLKSTTGGLYGQHTLDATDNIKLETGLRIDLNNFKNALYTNTEFFILPRISLLVKYNEHWSSRIGGGMGYKTPSIFNEQTETIQYRNIRQLNGVHAEKSYGGTADINFRNLIAEDLAFSFNHMFFYTLIENPLVLQFDSTGMYYFTNVTKPVTSAGFETNARFIFKEYFKLFLGYTFTETKAKYLQGNRYLPLVPKHKLNSALIFEKEGVIKLGLEGYFTGRQSLSNGTSAPAFQEYGFMAEKIFRKFSLYINFENFTDTRQSRYKPVVNGSHIIPSFDEIWTHTEGFVVNGGIKIRL
jgi:iron complex outermembrane receptor protein/outer membrane receptor for ferrienterochelin and colicins